VSFRVLEEDNGKPQIKGVSDAVGRFIYFRKDDRAEHVKSARHNYESYVPVIPWTELRANHRRYWMWPDTSEEGEWTHLGRDQQRNCHVFEYKIRLRPFNTSRKE
jgi:hypothetical protein